MRISDRSSDVCSSELADGGDHHAGSAAHRRADRNDAEDVFVERGGVADRLCRAELADELTGLGHGAWRPMFEWCVAENLADGVIGLPDQQGLAERSEERCARKVCVRTWSHSGSP